MSHGDKIKAQTMKPAATAQVFLCMKSRIQANATTASVTLQCLIKGRKR
jgi:hypothetical protein